MNNLVFGADGGATKTVGLITDQNGTPRVQRTTGATNVNVVGVDVAAERIVSLLRDCCGEVSCSPRDVRASVIGLAGAGRSKSRTALHERIIARLGENLPLTIETDARIALEGAFTGGAGVVVIAGTGSVVIGKAPSGTVDMCGGWGRLLGDEGSGYSFGVEALKSVAAMLDGRTGDSVLVRLVTEETGCHSREDVLGFVYHPEFDGARLAPFVFRAAEENDATALRILRSGAAALTGQLKALTQRLNMPEPFPVSLYGGLVQEENIYTRILKERIHENILGAGVRPPDYSPAYGAAIMALRQIGISLQTISHPQYPR